MHHDHGIGVGLFRGDLELRVKLAARDVFAVDFDKRLSGEEIALFGDGQRLLGARRAALGRESERHKGGVG